MQNISIEEELNSQVSSLIIYTVGHSNYTHEQFFQILIKYNIEVLVDVRSVPYSKFTPQFNIQSLREATKKKGIKYVYLGKELGGRPSDKAYYDERDKLSYSLLSKSPWFLEGINRLISGIAKYKVAIMCAEEDPKKCHRKLIIGKALKNRSVEIRHIRGDGRIETEQDTLPGV